MLVRFLTAFVLGALVIGVLFQGDAAARMALFGAFVIAGAWEWAGLAGASGWGSALGYVLLVGLVTLLAWFALWTPARFELAMRVAAAGWIVALFALLRGRRAVPRAAVAVAGLLVLPLVWLALARIATVWPRGPQWALYVLGVAFAMDTGGYAFGHLFGRLKLAPHISPGKTWEGVLGGALFVLAWALLGRWWFDQRSYAFLALSLASAGFAVVGDLFESLLKRTAGVKDSGRLLPGHGGVLDRIDGVTAAAPLLALGLSWLGVGA